MSIQILTQSNTKPGTYLDGLRKRKRAAIRAVARAITDGEQRLRPYFNEERAEIRWAQIKLYEWTDDERLTLLWLKGMLAGRLTIRSGDPMDLFPMNFDMKEAIFCALAQLTFSSHVINDHSRKKYEDRPSEAGAEH